MAVSLKDKLQHDNVVVSQFHNLWDEKKKTFPDL
jgi:hypothetical protein